MIVGLVGLGNLGSAIANLVASNGHPVIGWEYNEAVVTEINQAHTNSVYLPGVALSSDIEATTDLSRVWREASLVFVALPSAFIERTLAPGRAGVPASTIIVNMAKGIQADTGRTSFQVLSQLFPQNRLVMLSGPSIATEFARGLPTVVVIAGADTSDLVPVASVLDNRYFRTRFSADTIGVELGGILKNIYAIGLGLFDGADIRSVNFRAAYLTLALEEITRLGVAMGAMAETFSYLAGLGDLMATSLSEHSHNRHLGEQLAKGRALAEIKAEMRVLPEGYNTLKVTLFIAEKMHISLPLAKGLWDVINGRYQANQFIDAFIRDFVD